MRQILRDLDAPSLQGDVKNLRKLRCNNVGNLCSYLENGSNDPYKNNVIC